MAWRDFEDFAGNDGVGAGTVIGQSHGIPGTITLVQHKKGLFAVKKYVLEKPSNEQVRNEKTCVESTTSAVNQALLFGRTKCIIKLHLHT